MSPEPIDITKLSYEERQIDIIRAAEDRHNLVYPFPAPIVSQIFTRALDRVSKSSKDLPVRCQTNCTPS